MAQELLSKKLVISLNNDGTYSIQESTIPTMPIGNSLPKEQLHALIKEGVQIKFAGDLSSDAPKNIIYG